MWVASCLVFDPVIDYSQMFFSLSVNKQNKQYILPTQTKSSVYR